MSNQKHGSLPASVANSVHYIEDLTTADVEALTKLLFITAGTHPHPQWLADQAKLISTFPPSLQRPSATILRLAMHLPFTPPKAVLCEAHKPLNPHLIRRIFLQVSAECTTRLSRLTSCSLPKFEDEMKMLVKRIQTVNSLWMAAEIYRTIFQVLPEEPRFERLPGGCEACILAAVAGSNWVLTDLRGSIIGRMRKSKPDEIPKILPLLEGWIEWTGQAEEIRADSDRVAKKIRHLRREMQKERRRIRNEKKQGKSSRSSTSDTRSQSKTALLTAEEEIDEDPIEFGDGPGLQGLAEEDFESEIIDFYRNKMSSTSLIPPPLSITKYSTRSSFFELEEQYKDVLSQQRREIESQIHPAFQNSFAFRSETDFSDRASKVSRRGNEMEGPQYSQSNYSRESGFEYLHDMQNEPFPEELTNRAEEQARTYMALLGLDEGSKGSGGSVQSATEVQMMRDTRRGEKTKADPKTSDGDSNPELPPGRITMWCDMSMYDR